MIARRLLPTVALTLACAAPATAAPRIVSTTITGSPRPGGTFAVVVRAVDAKRPISSIGVRAIGEDGLRFGSSACRLAGRAQKGTISAIAAPYAFPTVGVHLLEITVGSGGCDGAPRTTTTSLAIAVTLPAPQARGAGAGCANADVLPDGTNVARLSRAVRCLLNAERTARGLKPLRGDRRLRRAAARYSKDMAARDFFSHTDPDGGTLVSRLKRARYWPALVGENLAWGTGQLATPRGLVDAWMASDGHRANILRPGFRQIGIGLANSGDRTYATTDFGHRRR